MPILPLEAPEEDDGFSLIEGVEESTEELSLEELRSKQVEGSRRHVVAILDLDGTLIRGFTKEKFVKWLSERGKGNPDPQRKLLALYDQYNKQAYPGSYVDLIKVSGELFAEMLEGVKVSEIQEAAEAWNKKTEHREKDFARPLIDYFHAIGITPTLITGTPQELLVGVRKRLEIREKCHGLFLEREGDYYTGICQHNTGMPHAKATVASKIVKKGHAIVFAMGDQPADAALFNAAFDVKDLRHDVFGSAVFLPEKKEFEAQAMIWRPWEESKVRFRILNQSTVSREGLMDGVSSLLHRAVDDSRNEGRLEGLGQRMAAYEVRQKRTRQTSFSFE